MIRGHRHASDQHPHDGQYEPPHDCPVCGDDLIVTRLGCDSCGTEVSGRFAGSAFAALDLNDRAILTVFLTSRGNMREVAKWLDVSYPTARQRFSEFLSRLGLSPTEPTSDESAPTDDAGYDAASGRTESGVDREEILRRLAAGEIDLAEATTLLGRL